MIANRVSTAWRSTPVLDQRDEGNLDWLNAIYRPTITASTDAASFSHQLSNADGLEALIEAGDARWAVEVRGLHTLHTELFIADQGQAEHEAEMPETLFGRHGRVFFPGMVAVRDCCLSTTTAGLNAIWEMQGNVQVPKGAWLVRGQHHDPTDHTSIVDFKPNPTLMGRKQIQFEYSTRNNEPLWTVFTNPETFTRAKTNQRLAAALTMSAFTAALSDTKNWQRHVQDGQPQDELTRAVISKLKEADKNCDVIGDPEFDPLRAAFLLCQEIDDCFNEEDDHQ